MILYISSDNIINFGPLTSSSGVVTTAEVEIRLTTLLGDTIATATAVHTAGGSYKALIPSGTELLNSTGYYLNLTANDDGNEFTMRVWCLAQYCDGTE